MSKQASEDDLDKLIEERVKIASTETKSGDEVVHIAWLADGIDLWNKSNGKFGHSPAKARRYIISSVTRLIRTEKLKLLAEVRERVIGEHKPKTRGLTQNPNNTAYWTKASQAEFDLIEEQLAELDKLEAEL